MLAWKLAKLGREATRNRVDDPSSPLRSPVTEHPYVLYAPTDRDLASCVIQHWTSAPALHGETRWSQVLVKRAAMFPAGSQRQGSDSQQVQSTTQGMALSRRYRMFRASSQREVRRTEGAASRYSTHWMRPVRGHPQHALTDFQVLQGTFTSRGGTPAR